MRVLLIEDDARLAAAIRGGLHTAAVVADIAGTGDEAFGMVAAARYDVIVLDVMLPDIDGFEICRRLRADGIWTPVIMVTARTSVDDRVRGLDLGAVENARVGDWAPGRGIVVPGR